MTRHLFARRDRDLRALEDPALAPLRAALGAEASPEETAGEPEALVAFRAVSWSRATADSRSPALRRSWRPAVLSSVLSTVFATKVSTALAAGAVGLTSVTGAAYAGALPDTLQDVAHKTIKAPAAHKSNGVGPDATGDAAWGLCQAFSTKDHGPSDAPGQLKDKANGQGKAAKEDRPQGKENSVAYRNLVRAAGGEDKIDAYCATVPRPSGEPESAADKAKDKADDKARDDAEDKGKADSGKATAPGSAATPTARATPRATPSAEPSETPAPVPSATESSATPSS